MSDPDEHDPNVEIIDIGGAYIIRAKPDQQEVERDERDDDSEGE